MLSDRQLREKISQYLSGSVSLDDFEDWFARESWNIHKSEDLGAQRLSYSVELRLAEHSSGHLPEQDLRSELDQLANSPILSHFSTEDVQSSTSLLILRPQLLVFRPADT